MVTPSGEFIFLRVDNILAVIPTEVAVLITPRKRACGSMNGISMNIDATPVPKAKDTITPKPPITRLGNENRRKRLISVSSPRVSFRWKNLTDVLMSILGMK